MLFTPDNAQKVIAGLKTQTRRPQQELDEAYITYSYDLTPRIVFRAGRLLWQVGKTYAVQPGRGKASIGRILLKSIRKERVNEISEADAMAEGVTLHSTYQPGQGYRDGFRTLWNSIYSNGMAFDTGPMVWVLEFETETF